MFLWSLSEFRGTDFNRVLFSTFSGQISILEVQILIKCCFQSALVKSLCFGLSQFHARMDFPSPGDPIFPELCLHFELLHPESLVLVLKWWNPFFLSFFPNFTSSSLSDPTSTPHLQHPFFLGVLPASCRSPKSLGSCIPEPAIPHRTLRHLLLIWAPSL